MVRCQVCGKDEQMPYRCSYCGKPHCSEHRLPEAHLCPGAQQAAAARLHRELTGDPGVEVRRTASQRGRASSLNKGLGKFEGKVALIMLGVIAAVWVLELFVLATAGSRTFVNLFVLDSSWPTKPWTLVTSVFAHAAVDQAGNLVINHVLFNGIVLFFFGPLLERRIGSRRFLWLFIVGGMLAGVAQVALYSTFLQSESAVVGASGGLMAVLGTLAVLGPRLTVLLFFVVPVPLWALAAGYAVLDLFMFQAGGSGIAHIAHLAGLVVGVVVGKRLRDQGFKFPGRAGHISAGPKAGRGW